MDKQKARQLFSLYRDGELSIDEKNEFEKLLSTDESLKEEYEKFSSLLDNLLVSKGTKAPDDFLKDFQKKMRKRSGNKFYSDKKDPQYYFFIYSFVVILIIMLIYLLSVYFIEIEKVTH